MAEENYYDNFNEILQYWNIDKPDPIPPRLLMQNDELNLGNDFNENNTQMYQGDNAFILMDSTQITPAEKIYFQMPSTTETNMGQVIFNAEEQLFSAKNPYIPMDTPMDNQLEPLMYNLDVQFIQPSDTNYTSTTMPSSISITNETWPSADGQQTATNTQIYSNYNQNIENMGYQNQCDINCNNTVAVENFFAAEHTNKFDTKVHITEQPNVKYNFSFPCDIEKNMGKITTKDSSKQAATNSQIYSNFIQNIGNMDYQNQCDINCNNTLAAENFFAAKQANNCSRKMAITRQPDVYAFSYPCNIKKNIGELTIKDSSQQDGKYITIKVWDKCHKWRQYFAKVNLYAYIVNDETAANQTYKLSHHILVQSTGKNGTIKNFKPIVECMTNVDGEYTFKMEKFHIRKTKDYIFESLVNKHLEEELWNEQNLNVNNNNNNIDQTHRERIRNKLLTMYPEYTTTKKKNNVPDTNLCLGFTIYVAAEADNEKFEKVGETIFSNIMKHRSSK